MKEFKFILQAQYGITFNISDFFDSDDDEDIVEMPAQKPQQVKLEPVTRTAKPAPDDDDLFSDPKPSKPAKPAKHEQEFEAPANKYGDDVEDIF